MSQENFEKLNILYGQIYEMSIVIGQLIDRKQINDIDNFLEMKENLFKEVEEILKNIGENADMSEFVEICTKIREQEALNINFLSVLGQEIKKEINKTNKKSKVVNAYSNVETKQGNLLDFRE